MWDCYGLECLFNISQWEREVLWATLKEEQKPKPPPLNILLLRARYNSHRNYEIYIFEAEDSITENDLKEEFNNHPQSMVDFIRKNGKSIFDGRLDTVSNKRTIV